VNGIFLIRSSRNFLVRPFYPIFTRSLAISFNVFPKLLITWRAIIPRKTVINVKMADPFARRTCMKSVCVTVPDALEQLVNFARRNQFFALAANMGLARFDVF